MMIWITNTVFGSGLPNPDLIPKSFTTVGQSFARLHPFHLHGIQKVWQPCLQPCHRPLASCVSCQDLVCFKPRGNWDTLLFPGRRSYSDDPVFQYTVSFFFGNADSVGRAASTFRQVGRFMVTMSEEVFKSSVCWQKVANPTDGSSINVSIRGERSLQ
jgi:hypothetical protein